MRTAVEAQRADAAMRISFGARHQSTELITMHHAREIILSKRTAQAPELGCWVASNEPAHDNGYKAVNLANTKSRVEGRTQETIGIRKMYLHHLALIAADRRDELSWCTQANNIFQVSHLCHNGGCFNPDHLQVEETATNKARNSCQGHVILEYSGLGPLRYHPCCHGGERNTLRQCILPTRYIHAPGRYINGE